MFDLEKYQFREAAITTVALSAAAAGYQVYQGQQQKKQAQKALNDYDRQDLDTSNPYENMPISTVGSDLLREENQRSNANAVDALRNGGARGIAMIPQVVANNNTQNRETRAFLDDKITKRDYAIAGDETAIRGMQEDRENADLAGLGQQLQVGGQNMWSGIRGLASSAMYAANNNSFFHSGINIFGIICNQFRQSFCILNFNTFLVFYC